jgi:hypothetical protein
MAVYFDNGKWLQALAGLTAHVTSLDLSSCWQVSDDGLRALVGLTALTALDGASFIVCLVYCLSLLVCDVYLYCGIKDF